MLAPMTMEAAVPAPEAVVALEPVPAGFWVRGGAYFVDMLVLAPFGVLTSLAAKRWGGSIVVAIGCAYLLRRTYDTVTVGRWGRTVGKMAAGVRITRADGARVGYARALGRAFAGDLSALLMDLGYAAAAFTPQKRALHDYLADTRVVYEPGVGQGRKAALAAFGVLLPVLSLAFGAYLGFRLITAQRGAVDRASGHYDRAAAADGLTIRLLPKSPEGWNNRCMDRALAGQLDGALEDCDEALRLGRSAAVLDSRGLVFLKMKRLDEAIASYDEALALDPKLADSLYGRGLARAAKGDAAGTAADIQAALKVNPGIAQTFHSYGFEGPGSGS